MTDIRGEMLEHLDHTMRCRLVIQQEADLNDAKRPGSNESVSKQGVDLFQVSRPFN